VILTHQRLAEAVRIVGRSLLTVRPSYANSSLAIDEAVSREERRLRRQFVDTWLRIHEADQHRFIWKGKNGGGEYRDELPAGTDPNSVVPIHVDSKLRPANARLDHLTRQVEALSEQPEIYDAATHETLTLADPATAQPELLRLKPTLPRLHEAIADGYNDETIAARMLLVRLAHNARQETDPWQIARYHLGQIRNAGHDLRLALAARLARDVFGRGLHGLAQAYSDEGERCVEEALSAPALDGWGEALYRAGLAFYLGDRSFQALAENVRTSENRGIRTVAEFRRRADGDSPARAVFCVAKLRWLRASQSPESNPSASESGGDEAGEAKIDQLIERQYSYPRFYRSGLAGSPHETENKVH
jgi:hypothetical protein